MAEMWQGAIDDLKIKFQERRINELNRLQEVYDQLNPDARKIWENLYQELTKTQNPEIRQELYRILVNSDFYNSVGRDLEIAQDKITMLKARKIDLFSRS